MLDKRCRYKVRELSSFYLFIKHKSIYYVYFPNHGVTRSTGETEIRKAWAKAWCPSEGLLFWDYHLVAVL